MLSNKRLVRFDYFCKHGHLCAEGRCCSTGWLQSCMLLWLSSGQSIKVQVQLYPLGIIAKKTIDETKLVVGCTKGVT